MASVTLSSKFQVVLPRAIREELALEAGQRFRILAKDGVIELVPIRSLDEVRGMLRGADAGDYRDRHDRIS
ncbi:MAG: AbrB/MazE/SpoVT family DNA-binding domain-containing protein [Halofilum sp. (in: g-proteobacteria)]|nr:AbrB/MazE/SpoVT family DNA-binding domain-containing protein [Halofilum sp. (in: g-proteobacteria)]